MIRIVVAVVVVCIAAAAVFGGRWYMYVTNTASPYDEVGIGINSRMPDPLNRWGCSKLRATFGNVVPPYGCGAADGTSWRS